MKTTAIAIIIIIVCLAILAASARAEDDIGDLADHWRYTCRCQVCYYVAPNGIIGAAFYGVTLYDWQVRGLVDLWPTPPIPCWEWTEPGATEDAS